MDIMPKESIAYNWVKQVFRNVFRNRDLIGHPDENFGLKDVFYMKCID